MAEPMSELTQDINAQWQLYKASGSDVARDSLVETYAPLVKQIAGRLQIGLPSTVEMGDLVGYGMLGLLDAMQKYAPDMGVKFETYASLRIKGAILDGLRAHDWAPRSLRQKGRQYAQAIAKLEGCLGRSASDAEIASSLGISVQEFEQTLGELSGLTLLSLEQPLDSDENTGVLGDMLAQPVGSDPHSQIEKQELLAELAEAIDTLPERERLILSLYYYEELTLKEIGAVLEITESRVCQLHTRALLRLRAKLEGADAQENRQPARR